MIKKLSLLTFVLLSTVFALTGCQKTPDTASENQANQPKVIKVGYISYDPAFIINPNTKEKSGIGLEVLQEIAKRENLQIDYTQEITWATMVESLNTNMINLVSYVRDTEPRREVADMSNPIYFSPVWAYVRTDENRLPNLESINSGDIRIIAIDGEAGVTVAQNSFPKAKLITLPNTIEYTQLLLEVQNNRADVVFMEPIYAYEYMKSNPGILKNIAEKTPVINWPNVFLFKKGDTELKNIINKGIEKMHIDGTLNKILDKYEKFPNAITRIK